MILDIQFAEIQRIGGADEDKLNAEIAKLKASNKALQTENDSLKTENESLESSNETLQGENAHLESELEELQASIKPEQEKSIDITENGTTDITPDENKTLSRVTINVDVPDGTEELENLIDESKVLDSTDGTATATEKVEQLIHRAYFVSKLSGFNFMLSDIERIDFYIHKANVNNAIDLFRSTPNLKYMVGVDLSGILNLTRLFLDSAIEVIQEPLDISAATNTTAAFTCWYLREVRFVSERIKISIAFTSPVLSDESIQSIIDGLATVETQQTLTVSSVVYEKMTDGQIETALTKGWLIA